MLLIIKIIAITALLATFISWLSYVNAKVVEKHAAPLAKKLTIISFGTYIVFYGIWMITE